jgi:hypothetical protein
MSITIFRHSHDHRELNKKFEELFRKSNIVVVEHGFKETYTKMKTYYNQLSQKGHSDYFTTSIPPFVKYSNRLENFIKNSGKQIEVEKSPVSENEWIKLDTLSYVSTQAFLNGKLEEACKKELESAIGSVEIEEKRENSLVKQLIELYEENENKQILVLIGANHLIYYKLKKKGIDVKQEFPYLPYFLSIYDELCRRLKLKQQYNFELVAQAIVYRSIGGYLLWKDLPARRVIENARRIAEKLSYHEIKCLSEYLSEKDYRKENFPEAIIIWLRKKGYKAQF